MTTLLLTTGRAAQRGIKKKTLSEHVSIGANTLTIILIGMICLVSVAYLVHSNKSAAMGYVLKELKEEEKALSQEESFWDLKIAQARSLHTLDKSPLLGQMRTAKDIEFTRGDTEVALVK